MGNKDHDLDLAPRHIIAKTEPRWKNACVFAVQKQKTDIKALNALAHSQQQQHCAKCAETVCEVEMAAELFEHVDGDSRGFTR
jgi:hypothetical protein